MQTLPDRRHATAGVLASLAASALFALLFYYTTLLAPLGGSEIYGWRVIGAVPMLLGLIRWTGHGAEITGIAARVRRTPLLVVGLLATAAMLGFQMWLFMWAPINGYALDVSLGYFLLPLTLVLTGAIFYKERVSRLQLAACALAVLGVGNELAHIGSIAWPAFVICLGYPVYYGLRRQLKTANLGGMWFDLLLSLPVAIALVAGDHLAGWIAAPDARLALLVLGLGVLSTLALALMITSSHLLSLPLFGLLSYGEPVLLVVVALLLGDRPPVEHWLTYGAIWLAVLVLAAEGLVRLSTGHVRQT
jgi:chloramphenicol-sensitive protein RarD